MKTTKVEFRYSWIYNKNWQVWIKAYPKFKDVKWPDPKQITTYIKKGEKIWRKKEKEILSEISKITGLSWKSKTTTCYIIPYGQSFSDPLTVRMYKDMDHFIDTVAHELMHRIWSAEPGSKLKTKKAWDYLYKRYKDESILTKNHVLVHAVHKHIFLKLFNENRLKKEIQRCQRFPDYKRSWEIVEKEGYKNIIKEFRKRIK